MGKLSANRLILVYPHWYMKESVSAEALLKRVDEAYLAACDFGADPWLTSVMQRLYSINSSMTPARESKPPENSTSCVRQVQQIGHGRGTG
jgi:hypothetical protein